MKWVKASERLPVGVIGTPQELASKWHFETGNTQIRGTTVWQFLDAIKIMTDLSKVEWLDESTPPVSAREDVFNEINQERIKQDLKWGEQNHAPADWLMILGEEVGEVNKAALEAKFGSSTLREYREELVQVAAVTVAMIECFDRNHLPPPPSK